MAAGLSDKIVLRSRAQIRDERRQLKAEYGELFDSVAKLLLDADPIGISIQVNSDEYHPEVGTILPRLKSCVCEEDVLRVVYEEFVRWFDPATAGPVEAYREIACSIWNLWLQRRRLRGTQT